MLQSKFANILQEVTRLWTIKTPRQLACLVNLRKYAGQESGRFFEKIRQKTFATFTRDVATSPGG
jgi:hypothetical protein